MFSTGYQIPNNLPQKIRRQASSQFKIFNVNNISVIKHKSEEIPAPLYSSNTVFPCDTKGFPCCVESTTTTLYLLKLVESYFLSKSLKCRGKYMLTFYFAKTLIKSIIMTIILNKNIYFIKCCHDC